LQIRRNRKILRQLETIEDLTCVLRIKVGTKTVNTIQDKSVLVNALREIFSHYITEDDLSIEVIADIAGLSTRSLQRIMKKHDLSYNDLLNKARQQYAVAKLNDPTTKITDIACQLGYNDAAHFTRAFKRWTRMAPSVYRKSSE